MYLVLLIIGYVALHFAGSDVGKWGCVVLLQTKRKQKLKEVMLRGVKVQIVRLLVNKSG